MSKTKPTWESQRARIFDSEEYETILPLNPVYFYDDFLGAWTAIPDVGVAIQSGCDWAYKHVETGGSPTVAIVADAAGGVAQCALDNTSEAQGAFLYMADDRRFIVTQGAVFEARVKVSILPTDVAEAVWGLAADYSAAPDDITYSAWFTADGSGEIICESDDTATDRTVTSGVTVTNTQWKVYRIDFRDVTSVKFYINGSRVAASTTFPYAGTAAKATLQPYFGLYKASGAGVGTIQVDYVRIWLNRS